MEWMTRKNFTRPTHNTRNKQSAFNKNAFPKWLVDDWKWMRKRLAWHNTWCTRMTILSILYTYMCHTPTPKPKPKSKLLVAVVVPFSLLNFILFCRFRINKRPAVASPTVPGIKWQSGTHKVCIHGTEKTSRKILFGCGCKSFVFSQSVSHATCLTAHTHTHHLLYGFAIAKQQKASNENAHAKYRSVACVWMHVPCTYDE